jgi:hypothetical protein
MSQVSAYFSYLGDLGVAHPETGCPDCDIGICARCNDIWSQNILFWYLNRLLIPLVCWCPATGQYRDTHLGIYCGIPAIDGGKAHFTYAVTVETPWPEQGRHTPLLSYIWNLATCGGKAHFMYAVTVETPGPEEARRTHLLSYIWNLATRGGKEHFMYAVTVETPWFGQARRTHLSIYHGNLKNVYACVL